MVRFFVRYFLSEQASKRASDLMQTLRCNCMVPAASGLRREDLQMRLKLRADTKASEMRMRRLER
jgi:hypothetical protein